MGTGALLQPPTCRGREGWEVSGDGGSRDEAVVALVGQGFGVRAGCNLPLLRDGEGSTGAVLLSQLSLLTATQGMCRDSSPAPHGHWVFPIVEKPDHLYKP